MARERGQEKKGGGVFFWNSRIPSDFCLGNSRFSFRNSRIPRDKNTPAPPKCGATNGCEAKKTRLKNHHSKTNEPPF